MKLIIFEPRLKFLLIFPQGTAVNRALSTLHGEGIIEINPFKKSIYLQGTGSLALLLEYDASDL